MLKRALHTYFNEYHPRNYKKYLNSFQSWWMLSYLLVFLPMSSIRDMVYDSVENIVTYYGFVSLVMLTFIDVRIPLALQKQMFLCPMGERERKEYVSALLGIKLLVPFIATAILMGMYALFFQEDFLRFCNVMVAFFSLLASGILYPVAEYCEKRKRANMVCCMINISIAIVCLVGGMTAMLMEEPISRGMMWLAVGSIVAQLLLDFLIMKWNIPRVIENATDYETCLRMQKRSTEPEKAQWQK